MALVCLYSNASASSFSSTVNSLWVARIFNFFKGNFEILFFVHSPYLLYNCKVDCVICFQCKCFLTKYQREHQIGMVQDALPISHCSNGSKRRVTNFIYIFTKRTYVRYYIYISCRCMAFSIVNIFFNFI